MERRGKVSGGCQLWMGQGEAMMPELAVALLYGLMLAPMYSDSIRGFVQTTKARIGYDKWQQAQSSWHNRDAEEPTHKAGDQEYDAGTSSSSVGKGHGPTGASR